jgi:uncharacterized tellurite resistance protein B-like protein
VNRVRGRHASSQAKPAPPASHEGPWLPPGSGIQIAGLNIIGGLLYLGSELRSASGMGVEPALIDPRLPVDMTQADWDGLGLDHWPSYAAIPPGSRAAYLSWLADGRCHPQAPLGYVLLYFYGLERRVLDDLRLDRSTAQDELSVIHEEVRRLLGLYSGHDAFQRHAAPFEELLGALSAPEVAGPPFALRVRLGEFAAQELPVPAEWALAWLRGHPAYRPRTAATRCEAEFAALFRIKYAERYGDGLVVRPGHRELAFDYRPANPGFAGAGRLVMPGVPDVLALAGPARELFALAEECCSALEAYSRFLGRLPNARQSVQAQALLPAELLDVNAGGAGHAVRWALGRLGGGQSALVPAEEFAALLSTGAPGRKDVIALAQILGRAGVGIEPDPRLGGPAPGRGSMALFAAPDGPTAAASDAYRAATVLLHLAAAHGDTSEGEYRRLAEQLERALYLTEGERARLGAHLEWMLAGEVALEELAERLQEIDEDQRAHVAEFVKDVATVNGHIQPDDVEILAKVHHLLGVDDTAITPYAAVRHAPIQLAYVQAAPAQPMPAPRTFHASIPAVLSAPIPASFDREAVARLAETARVGTLLDAMLAGAEPLPPPPPEVPPVAGLDNRHSGLVRALAAVEQQQVSRSQFEALAAAWDLLPEGAMERLNDTAYELAGDPLLDGEDPIAVDGRLLGEMLR